MQIAFLQSCHTNRYQALMSYIVTVECSALYTNRKFSAIPQQLYIAESFTLYKLLVFFFQGAANHILSRKKVYMVVSALSPVRPVQNLCAALQPYTHIYLQTANYIVFITEQWVFIERQAWTLIKQPQDFHLHCLCKYGFPTAIQKQP